MMVTLYQAIYELIDLEAHAVVVNLITSNKIVIL